MISSFYCTFTRNIENVFIYGVSFNFPFEFRVDTIKYVKHGQLVKHNIH